MLEGVSWCVRSGRGRVSSRQRPCQGEEEVGRKRWEGRGGKEEAVSREEEVVSGCLKPGTVRIDCLDVDESFDRC